MSCVRGPTGSPGLARVSWTGMTWCLLRARPVAAVTSDAEDANLVRTRHVESLLAGRDQPLGQRTARAVGLAGCS